MTPRVALLPWGDAIEDFLDPLGISLEEFRDELTGGWMFGYVEALRTAGVETALVCVARGVRRTVHWRHRPTGAELVVLPLPRRYRALRRALADPYAGSAREAVRTRGTAWGRAAYNLAPFAAMPVLALAREARRLGCAAILCQEYEYARLDAALLAGRLARVPVFATFQGGVEARTPLERRIRRLPMRAAAGFVIGSRAEAERVRERYGVPAERIAQIPNPLDVRLWAGADRGAGRAALGVVDDTVLVAWHGRVDRHRKGVDVLLDAWIALRDRSGLPARRLVLVGSGGDDDYLAGRLREAGGDDVTWVREYVLDKRRIAELLSAADVYAFPSRHEGFAVAPLEAMAAGLALVAAAVPGVAEMLPDGERSGGLVVPPGEPAPFADALALLLADRPRREEAGRRARLRVEEAFALRPVGGRLRRVLLREADVSAG